MPRTGALKKVALLCHRWTGAAFCLLFCWWFISGIFMMYVDFPEIAPADRLARAQAIDPSHVNLTAAQAWASLNSKGAPDEVRLAMFDARPAYSFRLGKTRAVIYADNGQAQTNFPPELNLRTAAAWTRQPAAEAHAKLMTEVDQWTVGGVYNNYEPITKYSWQDGEDVYLANATGEIVQYTTTSSRLLGYLGPVAHWLYFTPLRKNPRLWSRIVIWVSGAATLVALLGLYAGLSLYSPSKRIPFTGPKRLHMILGLFFGFLACTWSFSGMLSMDPFPLKTAVVDPRIPEAFEAEPSDFANFAAKSPKEALLETPSLKARQVEFLWLGGKYFYIVTDDSAHSMLVPVDGAPIRELDHAWLVNLVRTAAQPGRLAEARFIGEYDSHYLDRRHELPLPVLFVRLGDPQRSSFYIDPRTGSIVGGYASGEWVERWLYHGLHSINLPWLYNHRPAWDIAVLFLMLGGMALSITSAIVGWRFLRLQIGRKYTR